MISAGDQFPLPELLQLIAFLAMSINERFESEIDDVLAT
jgi:hypothetical protein